MNIFNLFFGELSAYDVPKAPSRDKVGKSADPISDKRIKDGWFTEHTSVGFTAERVAHTSSDKRFPELDGWDVSYLNEFHRSESGSPTWKKSLAQTLKKEWATLQDSGDYPSADSVSKSRTRGGIPESGFGRSNVKKYFHAFNAAQKRRLEEKAGSR